LGRDLEVLHARVEALQQELSQRDVALRRREKELEAVQRSLAETRARVDALESSWSWRLTGPGRRLVTWVSRERG
jgi:hypothetical protein